MQWQLLWYVLAGLIIGLTASTLWEWLYFRGKRMGLRDQRVTELEAEVRLLREQNQELIRLAERQIPLPTDYHSPGVFLENEEAESLRDGAVALATAAYEQSPPAESPESPDIPPQTEPELTLDAAADEVVEPRADGDATSGSESEATT